MASKDVALVLKRTAELTGSRPPKGLGRWMQRHFDALQDGFNKQSNSPDWAVFAVALAEAGIVGPNGSPFKADTVRRAWARTLKKAVRPVSHEPQSFIAPKVRDVAQPPRPKPAMPEQPFSSDEPEPDLNKMFPVLRRPKPTGA